jgi:hypothetical protein
MCDQPWFDDARDAEDVGLVVRPLARRRGVAPGEPPFVLPEWWPGDAASSPLAKTKSMYDTMVLSWWIISKSTFLAVVTMAIEKDCDSSFSTSRTPGILISSVRRCSW